MSTLISSCPAWCTTDHVKADADSVRATTHLAAEDRTPLPSGVIVNACAWWSGYEHRPPEVFVHFSAEPGNDRLSLDPESAYGLASLLELLKGSTPEQRRQLAAQVRSAADAIAKGGVS